MGKFFISGLILILFSISLCVRAKVTMPLQSSKTFGEFNTGVISSVHVNEQGVWLGSENGFFGKIGHELIKIDKSNSILESSYISNVIQYSEELVAFVAYGDGVYLYNPFSKFLKKMEIDDKIVSSDIWNLSVSERIIIIQLSSSVFVYDRSTPENSYFLSNFTNQDNSNIANVLYTEEKNTIWWLDQKKGLYSLDHNSKDVTSYMPKPLLDKVEEFTSFILVEDIAYIASDKGVHILNIHSGDYKHITEREKVKNSASDIYPARKVFLTPDNEILVAAERLYKVDTEKGKLVAPPIFSPVFSSGIIEIVLDLKFDTHGNMYGSDSQRGLFTLASNSDATSFININRSLDKSVVFDVHFLNEDFFLYTSPSQVSFHSISENKTIDIQVDSNGTLFFLESTPGEVKLVDENSKVFVIDTNNNTVLKSYPLLKFGSDNVRIIDTSISTEGSYVTLVTSQGRYILYFNNNYYAKLAISSKAGALSRYAKSGTFLGDYGNGVFSIRYGNSRFKVTKKANSFVWGSACIYEDSASRLWLCESGEGLKYVDAKGKQNEVSFFKSAYIRGISEIREGKFIVATNEGLYFLDINAKYTVELGNNFGISDVDFEYDSVHSSKGHTIVIGDNFSYLLNHDKLLTNVKKWQAQRHIVHILGIQSFSSVSEKFENIPISKNSPQLASVEIAHGHVMTEVNLAISNLIDYPYLRIEYRMTELSTTWRVLESSSSNLIFSSLAHGNYLFETRVKSDASSQPVTSLKIKVLPPWWLSPAAYAFYTLVVGVLAGYLIIWAYRQYSKQGQALKGQVKEKQTALESTNVYIRAMLERKQQLFVNVSHELQTPLTLITGPIQQIIANPDDADNSRRLQTINTNAQRLHALVNQILEIERLETLKDRPRQAYQLASFLPSFLANLASLAELHEQSLVSRIRAKGTINLVSDSLEKILFNLVSNAVKYSPPGAAIEVDIRCRDLQLVIVVTDSGPGMTEQEAALIFERFSRLPDAETTHGWGIGLALVKELVNANTGWIGIDTAPGKGARFSVYLPLLVLDEKAGLPVTPPDPIDTPPSVLQQANDTQQPVVLVVDDNEPLRDYLTDILTTEYCCLEAGDAKSALDLMHTIQPALVICDYRMPETSGVELRRQMLQSPTLGAIPFILMAAVNDDVPPTLSRDANIDMLVAKPLNITQLQHALSSLLSLQQRYQSHPATPVLPSAPFSVPNFANAREQAFYTRFLTLLADHFQDEDFGRALASSKMAISERQLSRKLNTLFGLNFTDVLRTYRLHQAKTMLQQGRQVTQVAYDVGFGTPSYFSSCFKAEINETPRQYQERHQQVYAGSV